MKLVAESNDYHQAKIRPLSMAIEVQSLNDRPQATLAVAHEPPVLRQPTLPFFMSHTMFAWTTHILMVIVYGAQWFEMISAAPQDPKIFVYGDAYFWALACTSLLIFGLSSMKINAVRSYIFYIVAQILLAVVIYIDQWK